MRPTGRSSAPVLRLAALFATIALLTVACSAAVGPLGTPSTPTPTGDASVVPPSGDATPGPTDAPTEAVTPTSALPSADTTPAATVPPPTPTAVPTPTPAPSGSIVVRAYFFLGSAVNSAGQPAGLTPVLREVPKTQGTLAAALKGLIEGPTTDEATAGTPLHTYVPSGTRLLGVSIRNGVASVDLSKEFTSGPLNSTWGAIAQVVFTATQFSTVSKVDFLLEGVGGWGMVASPADRSTFAEMQSPIFVDRPAWGAAGGNPMRVTGQANVFEAQFRMQLLDANGKALVDQPVRASCGTGCWGDFDVTLKYAVAKAQWGTLRAFDNSEMDGAEIDVVEYPVWLTSGG